MGHNRYATKGVISDETSHPYTHGNITLAHNGTLINTLSLPDNASFTIDSDNIAYAFAKQSPKEVISKLNGSFALTWYSDHELTFNIVRNSERTMALAKHKTKDVYYYASEEDMLVSILERNAIPYDLKEIKPGRIYTWDLSQSKSQLSEVAVPLETPRINNWGYPNTQKRNKQIVVNKGNNEYSKNGEKVGDLIEFYTTGLDATTTEFVLKGHSTGSNQIVTKIFNQRKTFLAGFYTGRLVAVSTSFVNSAYDEILILNTPLLKELVQDDPNNMHRQDLVNSLTKNKVIPFNKGKTK